MLFVRDGRPVLRGETSAAGIACIGMPSTTYVRGDMLCAFPATFMGAVKQVYSMSLLSGGLRLYICAWYACRVGAVPPRLPGAVTVALCASFTFSIGCGWR